MLGGCGIFDCGVDGVELDLKRLARRPLGPVSSPGVSDAAGLTFTAPRAATGPAMPTAAELAELDEAGEEENEEHSTSAGNSPIETTKGAITRRPRRPPASVPTLTQTHNPCVPDGRPYSNHTMSISRRVPAKGSETANLTHCNAVKIPHLRRAAVFAPTVCCKGRYWSERSERP